MMKTTVLAVLLVGCSVNPDSGKTGTAYQCTMTQHVGYPTVTASSASEFSSCFVDDTARDAWIQIWEDETCPSTYDPPTAGNGHRTRPDGADIVWCSGSCVPSNTSCTVE